MDGRRSWPEDSLAGRLPWSPRHSHHHALHRSLLRHTGALLPAPGRDRTAGERKGNVSSISTKELARAMPSPTRQCPLCHETARCCRADAACYAFEAFGPSGLIAALVFGRAVRVDASDDAGKAVWLSQGVMHGLLRGASPSLEALRAEASSEATKGKGRAKALLFFCL